MTVQVRDANEVTEVMCIASKELTYNKAVMMDTAALTHSCLALGLPRALALVRQ